MLFTVVLAWIFILSKLSLQPHDVVAHFSGTHNFFDNSAQVCLRLHYKSELDAWVWKDMQCSEKYNYLCKRPIQGEPLIFLKWNLLEILENIDYCEILFYLSISVSFIMDENDSK